VVVLRSGDGGRRYCWSRRKEGVVAREPFVVLVVVVVTRAIGVSSSSRALDLWLSIGVSRYLH
jgi:hypothetical protein